jgi:isopenicillin-N epimerase
MFVVGRLEYPAHSTLSKIVTHTNGCRVIRGRADFVPQFDCICSFPHRCSILGDMARFGHCMKSAWALDPEIVYLNHGTVGAPPRCVLEKQQELRDQIERQPSQFLLHELAGTGFATSDGKLPLLRIAADEVAQFLGAKGSDLVFVDNATTGVNAVLRSIDFKEGDEILILDQAYGAIRNALDYAARRYGASVRTVEIPLPAPSADAVIETIEQAFGAKTRLAIVDHITSHSALILPLAEIASRCRARGVAVLADGAHAPGAIPLDIPSLGVDWYTGNLHKWAWSPRSSGVLWTAPSRQAELHHTVISWGLDQGIAAEFDWPGTRDPTPHLAAPAGIGFMRELGVAEVQGYNHELAYHAGIAMAEHWSSSLLGPKEMIGAMACVPLPERFGSTREDAMRLRDALLFEHGIEVHVHTWKGRLRVRVSAQIYNEMSDVKRLLDAL